MKFKKYINELIDLPKKKWVSIKLSTLEQSTRHKLWDMYADTYQSIGLHIEDVNQLTSKYKVSWLIDMDADPEPDAFIIYKDTKGGKKIALLGSDGEKLSKKLLINKTVKLLKTKGWFVEASHKVADIFVAKGVATIYDMDFVKSVIGEKKFVEELDDGEYKRSLGSLGVVKKRMFGKI